MNHTWRTISTSARPRARIYSIVTSRFNYRVTSIFNQREFSCNNVRGQHSSGTSKDTESNQTFNNQDIVSRISTGLMAFQDNQNNVKVVGETFLRNLSIVNHKGESRYLRLVISSSHWGVGKTRFAQEFLKQWRRQIMENNQYKHELMAQYAQEMDQIDRAKLVYVDLRGKYNSAFSMERNFNIAVMKSICSALNLEVLPEKDILDGFSIQDWIKKTIPDTTLFLAIDELGVFASKMSAPNEKITVDHSIYNAYVVWESMIFPLQCTPNVFIYVCGKGAYLDVAGQGRVNDLLHAPTEIFSVYHSLFYKSNIENVLDQTAELSTLKEHLNKRTEIREHLINRVLQETRGVPLLVKHILVDGGESLAKCETLEEVDLNVKRLVSSIPEHLRSPFSMVSQTLLPVYVTMITLALFGVPVDLRKAVEISTVRDTREFGGFGIVTIQDVMTMLNCYVRSAEDEKVIVEFPGMIVDEFKRKIPHTPISIFESVVRDSSKITSTTQLLKYVTNEKFRRILSDGATSNQTVGKVIPFLKDTSLNEIQCSRVSIETLESLISKKSSGKQWSELLEKVSPNSMTIFSDHTYGPGAVIALLNGNKRILLCIKSQKGEISYNEFVEEILATTKMMVNKEDEVVLVVLASEAQRQLKEEEETKLNSTWFSGDILQYTPGKRSGSKKRFTIPEGMTIVLLHDEKMDKFLGNINIDTLFKYKCRMEEVNKTS